MFEQNWANNLQTIDWRNMQKSNIIVLLLVGLLLNYGCITRPIDRSSVKQNIIVLKNNKIELGIYPRFGGRVVWLSQPEAANILKTSAAVWQDTATNLPVLAKLPKDNGLNGQGIWARLSGLDHRVVVGRLIHISYMVILKLLSGVIIILNYAGLKVNSPVCSWKKSSG